MGKGKLLAEGKTKRVYEAEGSDDFVVIESKDEITKNDDPSQTRLLDRKAVYSTTTTCAVFELLKKTGFPVAYERRLSNTEFLAKNCKMIKLESVMRRYAVGSYLKRCPDFEKESGQPPYRFHRLVFELFLKTTQGIITDKDDRVLGMASCDALNGRPIDDPFISNPKDDVWNLKHPKLPEEDVSSDLRWSILRKDIVLSGAMIKKIEEISRKAFLVLEGAWAILGYRLIDFKIEFGIDSHGNLLIADVVDNDSWRLRTEDWQELSKQLFRDNAGMTEIADKYALVADMVTNFKIPKQAIVIWRESQKGLFPQLPELAGIEEVDVVGTRPQSKLYCLGEIGEVLGGHLERGVILVLGNMKDGLGSLLAARTSWPVIGVSNRCEAHFPMMIVSSLENAVSAALNILAQKNPVAYMYRQYEIEELDKDK